MRERLRRVLDAVERVPLSVRLAVGALAAAAAIAGTIAHERNDNGSDGSIAGAETPSAYRGGHSWMPSRAKPNSVVWAVGDAADGGTAASKVASMIRSNRIDLLLYLGDVYDSGTALEYDRNYRPIYGGLAWITAPTIGNHEWPNVATGYVPYWTAARGTPPPLWYAFAASGWQLISLNSNLPTSGDQEGWLHSLIEATPNYGNCRIAFMHHPRYSAGPHGDLTALQGIFDELSGHATISLSGHDHDMQRVLPIEGITQYVDGAGGDELYPINRDDARLAFFDDTHHGALRIALQPGSAVLTFVDQGGTTLDRSTVNCQEA
ncbi:MAG TPA: metallophosphoesterase [Solirubrobacterales bacterium]|nr:metallophosphoesterase [Solirubrobacterales bacterium]